MNNLLYLIVLLPIIVGILIYLLPSKYKTICSILIQVIVIVLSVVGIREAKEIGIELALGGWAPPIGIKLYMDSISGGLILTTSVLFLLFNIYNIYHHYIDKMFIMLFLMMQGLINGMFLVDDLFSVFVLIEVSTMVVSLLIMYKRDSRSIYDGLIYLLINTIAMSFFLFGIVILYKEVGSFSMSYIKGIMGEIKNESSLYLPYALIMTAISLKAALMPLFSWLPKAHGTPSAPAAVSAILSGIYVKSGIYLYIRLTDVFYTIDVTNFFLICGIITAVIGTIMALSQWDIKLLLSYSTVSQIGLIMIALNLGDETAWWGGIYHMINHAIFKSMLFLCVGIIVESYKTRDIREIRGVLKNMPLLGVVCIIGMLSITGAPLSNASFSKYFISKGAVNNLQQGILLLINFGTILYFIKFAMILPGKMAGKLQPIPITRKCTLIVLGTMCFLGGIFGQQMLEILYGQVLYINPVSYLSKSIVYFIMVAVGVVVYKKANLNNKIFTRIRNTDLGFNTIAFTIPAFFVSILSYILVKGF